MLIRLYAQRQKCSTLHSLTLTHIMCTRCYHHTHARLLWNPKHVIPHHQGNLPNSPDGFGCYLKVRRLMSGTLLRLEFHPTTISKWSPWPETPPGPMLLYQVTNALAGTNILDWYDLWTWFEGSDIRRTIFHDKLSPITSPKHSLPLCFKDVIV